MPRRIRLRSQAARRAPRRGCAARRLRRHSSAERRLPSSVAGAPAVAQRRASSRAIPSTSSGATTTPAPVSRISSAAAPSGGTSARIGRSAARYSKTFPERTPLAAAARLGDQQQQRLRVALQLERAAARHVGDQLEPVAEAERLGPLAVGRAEVADEAGDDAVERERERGQERPRVALAEERARVRDPEAVAPRWYSSPAKSSKSEPFAIVTTGPRGDALAHLLGDRLGDARRSRRRGARRAARRRAAPCSFTRTASRSRVAVRVRDERVAQVGDPAGRRSPASPRRRRGAPSAAARSSARRRSPPARTIRIAAGIAVRFQLTFSSGTSSRRPESCSLRAARARGPACRAAPRRACGRAGRRSARGAPTPASAAAARRRGGSTSGRPGASTCVSIPSSGRCVANFSGRCTPPPPAGGK